MVLGRSFYEYHHEGKSRKIMTENSLLLPALTQAKVTILQFEKRWR